MSNRIFQSVVLQMKEGTDRTVGVIDADGTVVACDDTTLIGERWAGVVEIVNSAENTVIACEGKTFKALSSWGTQFDYAGFVSGEDDLARTLCTVTAVAYNSLLGDIYVRAKELHVDCDVPRGVFLVRQPEPADPAMIDAIQTLFPDKQSDFVLSVSETDVAVVKQFSGETEGKRLDKLAAQIEEALASELKLKVVVGIGTVASSIRELAHSYKEAQMAIEVGKVFDTERSVISYDNLGIGRLIYQLPTTLCQMFLREVFKKNPIDALDQETLFTINKFFENNLNVSETARKLFVHRNTLVYRLEKIKRLTSLDLREFDDAITFKVALMVKKYLVSRGIED